MVLRREKQPSISAKHPFITDPTCDRLALRCRGDGANEGPDLEAHALVEKEASCKAKRDQAAARQERKGDPDYRLSCLRDHGGHVLILSADGAERWRTDRLAEVRADVQVARSGQCSDNGRNTDRPIRAPFPGPALAMIAALIRRRG